jgi:ferritin
MKFMLYLNKRGGRIMLTDIGAPDRNEWGSAEDAMLAALDLEKNVNEVTVFYFT